MLSLLASASAMGVEGEALGKLALTSGIGSSLQALGSIMQGSAAARGYKASAKAKELEAKEASEQSRWDQMRLLEQGRRLIATQRALYGQAGISIEGTPEDILRETKKELVLDKMMRARTGSIQKQALLAEAEQLRKAASAAKKSGIIGAFASFF